MQLKPFKVGPKARLTKQSAQFLVLLFCTYSQPLRSCNLILSLEVIILGGPTDLQVGHNISLISHEFIDLGASFTWLFAKFKFL